MDVISTRSLTKYYRKAKGVADLTMNVPAGAVYGFLGPNGAGGGVALTDELLARFEFDPSRRAARCSSRATCSQRWSGPVTPWASSGAGTS
ncbi:MAG: hypothetical protein AAGU73_07275 [Actinomycetota bacterium]